MMAQKVLKDKGLWSLAVIQDPETAESAYMPRSAIAAVTPDLGTIEGIADYIIQIAQQKLINYIKNEYDS
jgi:two-component system chemotaxis response regulator CheB